MNDRKRAWQILYTEICRRERGVPEGDAWTDQMGTLIRETDSHSRLIIELAGFGTTFAQLSAPRSEGDAATYADRLFGQEIMAEPDDEDER